MERLTIQSTENQQLIDISPRVAEIVSSWGDAILIAYVSHTTAGLLINANAEPEVGDDILRALEHVVSIDGDFQHSTGNSPSHIKGVLVGTSQMVPVIDGQLQLGTWQSLFLAEFDGPRERTVLLMRVDAA